MASDRSKTMFISGSAYEYGRFGDRGRNFIRDLSKALIRNDFKIITGFGSGVGNYVIEGALNEIYLEKKERLIDHLQIFPFPTGADYLQTIWEHYRNDIIPQAGITLFLFGNKLQDIAVREADGMLQEFEIAKFHKTLLIPVGASGYASEKIWKKVVERYDDYFDSREKYELYERLGDPCTEADDLIDVILQIAGAIPANA